MPLDYVDFAHFYEGSVLNDENRRENFQVFASILECVVRHFTNEAQVENPLGIKFDGDTLAQLDAIESSSSFNIEFIRAASGDVAERQEP